MLGVVFLGCLLFVCLSARRLSIVCWLCVVRFFCLVVVYCVIVSCFLFLFVVVCSLLFVRCRLLVPWCTLCVALCALFVVCCLFFCGSLFADVGRVLVAAICGSCLLFVGLGSCLVLFEVVCCFGVVWLWVMVAC